MPSLADAPHAENVPVPFLILPSDAAVFGSSGDTTAMTYELRVGTSICERALLASRSATAQPRSGMNGTSIKSTLEGRWVNTIVLTRPIRLAILAATR